jgi:transposase
MAVGQREPDDQIEWVMTCDLPKSPGDPFYRKLNELLGESGFDRFCERLRAPYYAEKMGRPSIPPGVYFRMLLVGYFEGIDSQRGIAWRCSDSLALRESLGMKSRQSSPDHSSLTVIRKRLPMEAHEAVFAQVLAKGSSRSYCSKSRRCRLGMCSPAMDSRILSWPRSWRLSSTAPMSQPIPEREAMGNAMVCQRRSTLLRTSRPQSVDTYCFCTKATPVRSMGGCIAMNNRALCPAIILGDTPPVTDKAKVESAGGPCGDVTVLLLCIVALQQMQNPTRKAQSFHLNKAKSRYN